MGNKPENKNKIQKIYGANSMTYPSLDEQIKIFPTYILWNTRLKKILLRDKNDYSHDSGELHHFIKEQEYYKNPDKYKGKQKLILMKKV